MSAEDALAAAREASPQGSDGIAVEDPQSAPAGTRCSVQPETAEDSRVVGELVRLDRNGITLSRRDDDLGQLHVHFPRLGYRFDALA